VKNKVLLLAEDDALFASLLSFRFTKEDYDVIVCNDGKEVKEKLNENIPDVIVCDIMMPYFSGLEILDFIRNTLKSNVPVFIISAAGNETNELKAFELGANDFITKPINPSVLMARITTKLIAT